MLPEREYPHCESVFRYAYLQALEAEAVGQHIRDRVESALSVLGFYLYPVGHALDDLVAYLPHEDKIFWQALCSGAQPVGNVDRVVPKSGRAADLLLIIQNTVNLLVIRDLRGHNHGAVSEVFFNIQYVHRVSVPGRLCVRHKKWHMPCAANIVAQLTSSLSCAVPVNILTFLCLYYISRYSLMQYFLSGGRI